MNTSNLRAHPMLIITGIALTIFALVGTAAVLGWIPKAQTEETPAQVSLSAKEKAEIHAKAEEEALRAKRAKLERTAPSPVRLASSEPVRSERVEHRVVHTCPNCGVIQSVNVVETPGKATPLGMIAGGVVGGLLGNQVGQGNGRTVATVAGAAGGAYAGNAIEKHVRKSESYRIVVRLNNGDTRVFHRKTDPGYSVGDHVKIENDSIVRI